MQFSTTIFAATAALLATASADGIFAIRGTGTVSSPTTLYLEVLNGLVGDPPKCSGTVETSPLPISGTIPCVEEGYYLSYRWDSKEGSIASVYATPSSPAFEYNVPNLGCDGDTCKFGFENLFPDGKVQLTGGKRVGKKARALKV